MSDLSFEDSNKSIMDFYVKSTECSHDSVLSMAVLLGDLQEAADKGAFDTGFDRSVINSHNACWIILRMRVKMFRMPIWRERFFIRTWSTGCEKFYFDREYEIVDSSNSVIGIASSLWILADMNTHRPLIPSKVEGLPSVHPSCSDLVFGDRCSRNMPIKLDSEFVPIITKYADYSELDHNHHVNNTRYMAWTYDALYKFGFDVSKISEFSLSYISEVLPGEKVELYVKECSDSNKIIVSAFKNDDINVFDAEICISD